MARRSIYVALFAACLALSLWHGQAVQAKQPGAWVTYDRAIADLTWVAEQGEFRSELSGTFSLRAPEEFSFAYQESNLSLRRIRGYRNFTATQFQAQTAYGYGGYPLFELWKAYFWPLTQIHQEPLVFVAAERLAHRDVDRYYLESDPRKVVWIDQQTNIPLLIMEGEQASLSVTNYRFDSGDTQQYRYVELELGGEGVSGKLTLWWGDFAAWVPVEMVITEGNLTNTLTFRNWELHTDQVGDLSILKTLEWEISLGETAYNLGQWEDVIASFSKVVDIDPYYLPGYFFLAHAFYFMDNYFGAVENLQQGLMLQPDNALLLNNLAYIYMERRVNLGEAVRMAEQAVAQSRRAVYLDTLGYGYFLLGQYDLAQAILEEALAAVDESVSPESRGEIELHLEMVYHALEGD
jgi:tetratricopeptide (TPR) repeat protein